MSNGRFAILGIGDGSNYWERSTMRSNGFEALFAIPIAVLLVIKSNPALPFSNYYVSLRGEIGLDRRGGIWYYHMNYPAPRR
jgi:hypothetical protein